MRKMRSILWWVTLTLFSQVSTAFAEVGDKVEVAIRFQDGQGTGKVLTLIQYAKNQLGPVSAQRFQNVYMMAEELTVGQLEALARVSTSFGLSGEFFDSWKNSQDCSPISLDSSYPVTCMSEDLANQIQLVIEKISLDYTWRRPSREMWYNAVLRTAQGYVSWISYEPAYANCNGKDGQLAPSASLKATGLGFLTRWAM